MIKKLLRAFVIETTALYLASQIAQGLSFEKGVQSLLLTGFALGIASFVIRPIINILLLPINLVTFNLFKWLSHAVTLFLVDLLLSEFSIGGFRFLGLVSDYLDIPAITLDPGVLSYLAFSVIIATIANVIYWVVDK